jgi:hypothetical protein
MIVAKIAELNLKPQARDEIRKLLGPTPISDRRVATFADFVKHNPDFPEYAKTPPWHFVDVPYDADSYDPERDCKDGSCVVERIEVFKKTLADKTKPSQDRLEALMFLVHLVGDLHQPLHCATRNDRGGNDLPVGFLGHAGNHLNLHAVWDENLVQACMGHLEPYDYAGRLNAEIQGSDRSDWQTGEAKDWAWESHQAAVKRAYADADGHPLPKNGHPNLDDAYVAKGKEVVAVQLKRGGIRLARILNDALAP